MSKSNLNKVTLIRRIYMVGELSINNMNDVSNNQKAVYGLNNMNSTTNDIKTPYSLNNMNGVSEDNTKIYSIDNMCGKC